MSGPISTWRSAITEQDGKTVDVGYLSLAWLLHLDVVLSILTLAAGFVMQATAGTVVPATATTPPQLMQTHEFPFTGVAAALGAIWGTFTTALGALGLYRRGDKP